MMKTDVLYQIKGETIYMLALILILIAIFKCGYDVQKSDGMSYKDGIIIFIIATFALLLIF